MDGIGSCTKLCISHFSFPYLKSFYVLLLFFPTSSLSDSLRPERTQNFLRSSKETSKNFTVTNLCSETIYPAFSTQAGSLPNSSGFALQPQQSFTQLLDPAWQGRVWGRTNCSFNSDGTGPASNSLPNNGRACYTGDCNGILDCKVTGDTPVTLAEFNLLTDRGFTYYDISLVDGYNLPLAIVSLHPYSSNVTLTDIPPNLTNPVCIGTAALLAAEGYNPNSANVTSVLGTNGTFPLPFDNSISYDTVEQWCPWELQLDTPSGPQYGVYSYPDSSIIQTPIFNPCYSDCAKTGSAQACCTGSYDSPQTCRPGTYSQAAKKVCPDAYSYAFDDANSTFEIPSGAGFQVIFCPPGRSTNILATYSAQLQQLAQSGQVTMPENVTARSIAASGACRIYDPRNFGRQFMALAFAVNIVLVIAGLR